MVTGEPMVHGWDLARATGQHPEWDEDLLRHVHGEVARSAARGRGIGVYGPDVPAPAGASTLDRMLGLTGRDPAWTP